MPIDQQSWCSSSSFFAVHLIFITLLRSFPAIYKNIGFAFVRNTTDELSKKVPIPCAIIIGMFCFGFPSSVHIALFLSWFLFDTFSEMYKLDCFAKFTRKEPLYSVTQNRWWHHIEAQLCFETDSKWNFQETSTISKKLSNFPRNTETNWNVLLHGVLWLLSIRFSHFFIADISKYDLKWVSTSDSFQLLCRQHKESICYRESNGRLDSITCVVIWISQRSGLVYRIPESPMFVCVQ